MNHKVRRSFAVAAAGALVGSMAFAQGAAAAQNPITNDPYWNVGVTSGFYAGRIAGIDRFGTAVAASKALQNVGDTVFLVNANAWADALTAAPLADVLNAPLLYTNTDALESKTVTELKRLMSEEGVTKAIMLGGTSVISDKVAAELAKLGFSIDRIGGADRFETGMLLAAETVDHYNGTYLLASDRADLADLAAREQAYKDALAAWEAARADTAVKQDAVDSAQAAVDAANKALLDVLAGLVTVPTATLPASVTYDGTTYPITSLSDYANVVTKLQAAAADVNTVKNFVLGILNTYAADTKVAFQDAQWTDIEAHFGTTEYTVTLSTGTYTGTLADLSANLPYLQDAPLTETGGDVATYLSDEYMAAQATADKAAADYAAVVAAFVAAAKAEDANAALATKIADAYAVLKAAQDKLAAAQAALAKALTTESDALDALIIAAAARPTAADWNAANKAYQADLSAVLAAGTKYPAFLASGRIFPDSLSAGPAAAAEAGVVVLSNGTTVPASTQRYLDNGSVIVAVGGEAAAATTKESVAYVGKDRFETATKVAAAYFTNYEYVGLASGEMAPDAVIASSFMANADGPIVLTNQDKLPNSTYNYLAYEISNPWLLIFGGPVAISDEVKDEALKAIDSTTPYWWML